MFVRLQKVLPKSNNKKSLIKKIENEISKKELEKKTIEQMMLTKDVYIDYKKMNELQKKLESLDEEILFKMQEWEDLNS